MDLVRFFQGATSANASEQERPAITSTLIDLPELLNFGFCAVYLGLSADDTRAYISTSESYFLPSSMLVEAVCLMILVVVRLASMRTKSGRARLSKMGLLSDVMLSVYTSILAASFALVVQCQRLITHYSDGSKAPKIVVRKLFRIHKSTSLTFNRLRSRPWWGQFCVAWSLASF